MSAQRPIRRLLVAALLLAGCQNEIVSDMWTGAPPLNASDERLAVPCLVEARLALDLGLPTDLAVDPKGGFVVLDGERRRLARFDERGQPLPAIEGQPTWGNPTRLLVEDGGYLLADPGRDDAPGALVRTDARGGALEVLQPVESPIALAARGDRVLVAGRGGEAVDCAPDGADCRPVALLPAAQDVKQVFVDLAVTADGGLLAVDALGAQVQHLPRGGEPKHIGEFGRHVGALTQPSSAVEVPGGAVLVADAELGVLQLFEIGGRPLGVLVAGDAVLWLDHPTAVRSLGGDRFAVLASRSREVVLIHLPAASVAEARGRPDIRRIRTPLVPPGGEHGRDCRRCHDGLVHEGREVFDEDLHQHPVDFVPERPLPPGFPLDDAGMMTCSTCHAAHTPSEDGVAAAAQPNARLRIQHGGGGREGAERSALCIPCHEKAAHGGLGAQEGLVGAGERMGHRVGLALARALADRPEAEGSDRTRGDCLGCHANHGAAASSLIRGETAGSTCTGCHADHAEKELNHALGSAFGPDHPKPGASARLLLEEGAAIGCITCHDVADGRPPVLLRTAAGGAPLCEACHGAGKVEKLAGHAKLGRPGLPACVGCHDVHGVSRDRHMLRKTSEQDPGGCRDCHAPGRKGGKRGVEPGKLGHAVDGAGEGIRALEGCATCHDVHEPAADPRPCGECHAEEARASEGRGHGKQDCLACHPMHGARPRPPASAAKANPASARCLGCHAEDASGKSEKRVDAWEHPAPVFLPDGRRWEPLGELPLFDDAGEPVAKGQNGDLTCSSCHRTHGAEEGDVDHMRRPGWQKACAACHGADALPLYRWFHRPDRRAAEGL